MSDDVNLYSLIQKSLDSGKFRELNWTGTFHDYLALVHENPNIARNAFQRVYDMIMSYGTDEYTSFKEPVEHYKFFDDPVDNGREAVFGLDKPLMRLVNFFKSAAHSYGTEKRVLLLHGPVGSSKSTIVRMLKKGLERYSETDEGTLYTFQWETPEGDWVDCPMNEDPLYLVPQTALQLLGG